MLGASIFTCNNVGTTSTTPLAASMLTYSKVAQGESRLHNGRFSPVKVGRNFDPAFAASLLTYLPHKLQHADQIRVSRMTCLYGVPAHGRAA